MFGTHTLLSLIILASVAVILVVGVLFLVARLISPPAANRSDVIQRIRRLP